ncbi:hypothetical protein LIER_05265 [Lithospermum erythrorhizon]|uniref:Uncharacterized protein n=1 Tax=Lithospermum erythrorhizon TaxID=34254 RepID=A0AAV3NZV6_LITER
MLCSTSDRILHMFLVFSIGSREIWRGALTRCEDECLQSQGTSDISLNNGGDSQYLVSGYSDSSYAGYVNSKRSMTDYVFTLGGYIVSWKTTLHPTMTLSTTEGFKRNMVERISQ